MGWKAVLGAAVCVVALVSVVFTGCRPAEQEPEISRSESVQSAGSVVDSVRSMKPTMLELGSEGCIPCEQMKPVMDNLRELHGDLIEIQFHDVRKEQDIARKYKVRLIPTQVFLTSDGTEFFRHEGYFPQPEIEKVFRDMGVPL